MGHAQEPAPQPPGHDPFGRFLTPAEVADRLRVSTTTVLRWIHEGRLPAIRVSDRVVRVPVGSFERFVAAAPSRRPTIAQRRVAALPRIGDDEALPDRPPARELLDPSR
ncbi:MAG TPA: helix-turn-helix domain-containing protein [Candidatus Limnocylindrales bacterium]|nr:helix-turn-helix domain-containing protein [Candidatus Limnocylindrales bacterium]